MVEPQETLREILQERIGLTGTKEMCDRGACGSCTVIMDGRPVLSCMILAVECGGHEIETIEQINSQEHPLVEAYADNHAMQCGYCTPGFVVTAKALLDKNPDPSEEEIIKALEGNICRCGTYPAHILAVQAAAKKLNA
jgi:aerobic-type carbon monoxide dehydrogenase small subunit (CoxS/CutS family)